MAQRVTLAVPNPAFPGTDVNIGTIENPLVTSGGGTSSNPGIVGGEYNSTLPTLSNSQTDALQMGSRGALNVTIFGQDSSNSVAVSGVSTDGLGTTVLSMAARSFGYIFNGTSWDRQRGDTIGTYTVAKGSSTMATNQVSVGTGSTLIVAARAGRSSVTITNLGATDIFIGNTGVALTTGTLLVGTKGAAITIPTSAAIYGIASVAQSVSFIENY